VSSLVECNKLDCLPYQAELVISSGPAMIGRSTKPCSKCRPSPLGALGMGP
jgi:hypothetical protein